MYTIKYLQMFTVCMGFAATAYPLGWGFSFHKQSTGIGRVIGHMLYGEAFIMAMALWFSIKSLLWEAINSGSYIEASVRNMSFLVALVTTIGLVRYLRKIQHHAFPLS